MGDRVTVLKQGRVVGRPRSPEELAGRIRRRAAGRDRGDDVRRAGRAGARARGAAGPASRGTAPQRELLRSPVLELDGPRGGGARGRAGPARRLAARCGPARSWASPASTATASASWRRRSRASGRRPPGDIRFRERLDRAPLGPPARAAGPSLRQRRPPGRGHGGRCCSVGLNLVLKRIGQAPFWRRGTIRHARGGAQRAREDRRVRHPHARAPQHARRDALGRQRPEGRARARARRTTRAWWSSTSRPTASTSSRPGPCARASGSWPSEGVSALVISTDLDELVALCDRIAVLSRGRLAGDRRERRRRRAARRRADGGARGRLRRRPRRHEPARARPPDARHPRALRRRPAATGRGLVAGIGRVADAVVRSVVPGAAGAGRRAGSCCWPSAPTRSPSTATSGPAASSSRPGRTPSCGWRPCCSSPAA